MELTPLPGVLLFLSITVLFPWRLLVVLSSSCVMRAKMSLAFILQWARRSKVSLVLWMKFLLYFDNIPMGISKRIDF